MLSIRFVFLLVLSLVTATNPNLPNYVYKYDSGGNVLDAHDGKLYYFDDVYYFYGTAYDCGFRWRTSNFTTPFCGFKQYSSTDLKTWKDEGYMFDANTTYYQELCADTAACFRPKVIRNPTTKEYVMWMNSGSSNYSYTVFTSMSPLGPYVQVNQPVLPFERGSKSYGNGDFGIHIGPDGNGYVVYDVTPVVSGPELFVSFNVTYGVVQQLTPNYTAVEPAYEVTDLTNTEAWDIWYRDGWWYLSFGRICGYCDSTDTSYIKSRSPLGPWHNASRVYITNSSCGGQHNMVAELPSSSSSNFASGSSQNIYLYGSDLWTGDVNEGKAGSHWEPLQFTPDGDIMPLNCYAPSYDMNIQTTTSTVEDVMLNATVASAPGNYTWTCKLGDKNQNFLYQFFQAPKNGTWTEFGMNIAQQANNADVQVYVGQVYNISELFTTNGGVKEMWSTNYPQETIGWALPMIYGYPNVTVTGGEWYAIFMTARATSIPYCYLQHETGYAPKYAEELVSLYDFNGEFVPPKSFLGEIKMGQYPLFGKLNTEMRYYVDIQ